MSMSNGSLLITNKLKSNYTMVFLKTVAVRGRCSNPDRVIMQADYELDVLASGLVQEYGVNYRLLITPYFIYNWLFLALIEIFHATLAISCIKFGFALFFERKCCRQGVGYLSACTWLKHWKIRPEKSHIDHFHNPLRTSGLRTWETKHAENQQPITAKTNIRSGVT
jgi:hypothetical protein